MEEAYVPPSTITPKIVHLVSEISEQVGGLAAWESLNPNPRLRRDERIRTIHASLAIENNSLSLEQMTAIIGGKRVLGPPGDIREVQNAYQAYERLPGFDPYSVQDLLAAHRLLMEGLVPEAGMFRQGGVGVFAGQKLVHMAPPAHLVPQQARQLLDWVRKDEAHPLIKSCVFHYEFEFIHPFSDGNGRMGRLWQTLLLSRWKPLLGWLPVEALIRERQDRYYAVLGEADRAANSTPVIEFLLIAIGDALGEAAAFAPKAAGAPVRRLLQALGKDTLPAKELMARLGLKSRATFRQNYLVPALEQGLVEMLLPDKPNSSNQKYRRRGER